MIQVKNLVIAADNQTRSCFGRFIFSGSYPAGGEVIDPSSVGAPGGGEKPLWTMIAARRQDVQAYAYFIDYSTWKLVVKSIAAGVLTEIAGGAYPQEVIDDSADFYIRFPKF